MNYRSSHWRCSLKRVVLENFAKLTGKHLWQSLFFNLVAGVRPQISVYAPQCGLDDKKDSFYYSLINVVRMLGEK